MRAGGPGLRLPVVPALPSVDAPIGIFDSGFGGLTVARSVIDQLPHESVHYLGDTARQPYGPKPIAEVREYALECLDHLYDQGVKALVIACNSRERGDAARRPGAVRRAGGRGDPAGHPARGRGDAGPGGSG